MLNVIFTIVALALAGLALGWRPSKEWATASWTFVSKGFIELANGRSEAEFLAGESLWLLWRRILGALAVLALLLALVVAPAGYRADGSWRSLYEAVVAFQLERGLTGDGVFGPKTLDAYRKGE
jgi:hypothetical protein